MYVEGPSVVLGTKLGAVKENSLLLASTVDNLVKKILRIDST